MSKGSAIFRLSALGLLILGSLPLASQAGGAEPTQQQNFRYVPRFTAGPFYSSQTDMFGLFDAFVPFTINPDSVVFVDGRYYDHQGISSETNIGVGVRNITANNSLLWTAYGFFDTRRTRFNNYFNQVTFGGDIQTEDWYFSANGYVPVGDTSKTVSAYNSAELVGNYIYYAIGQERSMGGADAQVGYTIPRTGLTGYVGGYVFARKGVKTAAGPNLRVEYAIERADQKRWIGIFDKVTLVANWRDDDLVGSSWFAGARFDIGIGPQPHTVGLQRKMTSFIRRDLNVEMSSDGKGNNASIQGDRHILLNPNGSAVFVSSVGNEADLNTALGDANTNIVAVNGAITYATAAAKQLGVGQTLEGGQYDFSAMGQDFSVQLGHSGRLNGTANLIDLTQNNTIENMTFQTDAADVAITQAAAGSIGTAMIRKNRSLQGRFVLLPDTQGSSMVTIANNVATNAGSTASGWVVELHGSSASAADKLTAYIYGNTITSVGSLSGGNGVEGAIGIQNYATAGAGVQILGSVDVLLQNNIASGGEDTFALLGEHASSIGGQEAWGGQINTIGDISGNNVRITGATNSYGAMLITGNVTVNGGIRNNTFIGEASTAAQSNQGVLELQGLNNNSIVVNGDIAYNVITYLGANDNEALALAGVNGGAANTGSIAINGAIVNNTITNNSANASASGILVSDIIQAGSTMTINIAGGIIGNNLNTMARGIDISANGTTSITVNGLYGNVSNAATNGLLIGTVGANSSINIAIYGRGGLPITPDATAIAALNAANTFTATTAITGTGEIITN